MRRTLMGALVLAAAPAIAGAQQPVPAKPEVPPRDREVAMALSAAPDHLRDGAGIYTLTETGYVQVRASSNGLTCIVNRDHPLNLKPTCYDAEGTATILPKVVQVGAWMMEGKPMSEIASLVAEGFKTGRFISPRRPGVAYMTFFVSWSAWALPQSPAPLGPGSPPPVPIEQRGLASGERVPALDLADQTGRRRGLKDLTGPKGLVLLFVRSADW